MAEKKDLHVYESSSGTTRVRQTTNGDIVIDSYYGDVRDRNDHDRFTLNATKSEVSGHGFEHKDSFDTSTGKGCSGGGKTK